MAIKLVLSTIVVIAMVVLLSTLTSFDYEKQENHVGKLSDTKIEKETEDKYKSIVLPSKRVNRFLSEISGRQHGRILKPADHCNKDYEICDIQYGVNSTCCGNKCFDLAIDKANCGACHNKCKFSESCCGGKCVNLNYDKRHCGECNNRCLPGQYCIYGMCDYA